MTDPGLMIYDLVRSGSRGRSGVRSIPNPES
jgi:hypothetical protein